MPLTDYFKGQATDLIASGMAALYTTAPTDTDPGVEVTGGAYAKQAITMVQDPADSGLVTNSADVVFAGVPECDVVAVGVFDSTGTNLMYYQTLSAPKTFAADDTGTIGAGLLSFTLG